MPQSVPHRRARGGSARGGLAGVLAAVALVVLALSFVCDAERASSWVRTAGLGSDDPPPAPQTRIVALRPLPPTLPRAERRACTRSADCADGACTRWFEDADGDGFGNPDTERGFCGDSTPPSKVPLVRNGQDCCDLNAQVRPTQTEAFASRIPESCPLARGFDYDCDGVIRYGDDMGASVWAGACDDGASASNAPNVPCAERGGIFLGAGNALGLTLEDLVTPDGEAALCGNASVEWKRCSLVGAACEGRRASAPPCN